MTQDEMIKAIKDDMEELDQRVRFNSMDIDAIQDELWDHIDEERTMTNDEVIEKLQSHMAELDQKVRFNLEQKKTNIEKAIVYGVVLGWMASMLYLVLMIAAKVA